MAIPPVFQGGPIARSAGVPDAARETAATGIIRGVGEVGGALYESGLRHDAAQERVAELQRQRVQMDQTAAFGVAFAQARSAETDKDTDVRTGAVTPAPGYAEARTKAFRETHEALMAPITDPQVRAHAIEQLAGYTGQLHANAYGFESAAGVAKVRTDFGQRIDLSSNMMRSMTDPKAIAAEFDRFDTDVGLLPVGDALKDQMKREGRAQMSQRLIEGTTERDPARARAILESPEMKAILSPRVVDALSGGIDVEERRAAAEARAAAATEKTAQREMLATQRAALDAGAGLPQDWDTLANGYEAVGDTSSAVTARARGAEMKATIGYRDENLPQLDARIGALTTRQTAGGLSATQASELKGLQGMRAQVSARLSAPGGALNQMQVATGRMMAPIAPNADPAAFAVRGQQARVAASTYGRSAIEPILQDELPAFKDLVGGGVNGKLQAIDMLRHFGDARTIAGAAKQIAGEGDGSFRIAALMPHDVARDVLRGAETLVSNPKVWNDQQGMHDFNVWYGRTLGWTGGSYRSDIFQAAKAFYAQRASDAGHMTYDAKAFDGAIQTVLGRDGAGRGGIARTPRGIVLAPAGVAPDAMLQRFARASPTQYAKAASGRTPRWSDGSAITVSAFKQLLPTQVDDGRYAFRDQHGQLIHDDQEGTYKVDLYALMGR